MNKKIDINEALDWYLWAGVSETCGDFVCLSENKKVIESSSTVASAPYKQTLNTATTSVVLNNARDICKKASSLEELKQMLLSFEGCNLKNTAASTILGEGNPKAKLMLIGEAPGADEDRLGRPFVGRCGKLLDKMLEAIHCRREDCYITNILPWRPPGNRTPTDEEVAVCLPFLKRQIELIQPDVILLLGGIALKSVMDYTESISRARGKWLEYSTEDKNIPVLATYHPSYLLRSAAQKSKAWIDLIRLQRKLAELK